jgi:hypothetical protein
VVLCFHAKGPGKKFIDFTAFVSLELQHFAQILTSDISSVSCEILCTVSFHSASPISVLIDHVTYYFDNFLLKIGDIVMALDQKTIVTVSPVGVGLNDVESLIVDVNIRHPENAVFCITQSGWAGTAPVLPPEGPSWIC